MSNIWLTWGDVFNASLQSLWWGFIQFAPKLILAIVFFIIGWVLGNLVAKAFDNVIATLKLDRLFQSIGLEGMLMKMGLKLNVGYFIGQIVKWFILIAFLLPSLSLMGLDTVTSFLKDDVLAFLPRVIVAAFILIIATVVAEAISRAISGGAKAMNLRSANMLASIARYAIWIFAFIIALGQLGVAPAYMQIMFTGVVGMLAIAGALAFGLGGKDAAARLIENIRNDTRHE
ncbi:MAG: hypothetical protein NTZ44_03505 [Candidatus Nomurabacteria bacterium]|nr:hypothetical protein [Candidatus Nomurabacteria bacterium]